MKILVFLVSILFIIFIILLVKFIKIRILLKKAESDNKILIRTIQKARYGQIGVRVKGIKNKELQAAVNRLLETINDRENMIIEYQKSLSQKNKSLEKMITSEHEAQKFKEDFIATLTHDMKTPVIAELNAIEILLSSRFGELNDKQIETLKLMKNSNEELIELAEILLDTYKIQQNQLVLTKNIVNMADFIDDIVMSMSPIASASHIELAFATEDRSIDISIDKFQMKRVLKNLILNAISYCTANSKVEISFFKKDKSVIISVTNEGKGISKEDIELVFAKFYTSVNKYRKMGTGLGLYLANQIVVAHKGKIDVDSVENGKTTFNVELPL